MSYSKRIYSKDYDEWFPSAVAAARCLRDSYNTNNRRGAARAEPCGCGIAAAARATARKKYATIYGSQWAYVIPKVWPLKSPRKPGTISRTTMVPVVRDDGVRYESITEAARQHSTDVSYMSLIVRASEFGFCKMFKGHQFASVKVFESEGFEWPVPFDVSRVANCIGCRPARNQNL